MKRFAISNKVIENFENYFMSIFENGPSHNGFYRGKNLGTLTSTNIDDFCSDHEISTGKFTDLFLGDYFVIQDGTYNKEWMIAGFDLNYNRGFDEDSQIGHSIYVIPRGLGLIKGVMFNTTDTFTGGYSGSNIQSYLDNTVAPSLQNALGTHLKDQQCFLTTDSAGTVSSKFTKKAVLMTITNLINSPDDYVPSSGDYYIGTQAMDLPLKLPVFNYITPVAFAETRETFWLRNITAAGLCYTYNQSISAGMSKPNRDTRWVRPLIQIA